MSDAVLCQPRLAGAAGSAYHFDGWRLSRHFVCMSVTPWRQRGMVTVSATWWLLDRSASRLRWSRRVQKVPHANALADGDFTTGRGSSSSRIPSEAFS